MKFKEILSLKRLPNEAKDQKAAVTRGLFPLAPGLLAPLEFQDDAVAVEGIVARDAAPILAGNPDHAILDREDLVGVVVDPVVAQVDVEIGEVLAVKQGNGLGDLPDFGRGRCGEKDEGSQSGQKTGT